MSRDESHSEFLRAMSDVEPLTEEVQRVRQRVRQRAPARGAAKRDPKPVRFEVRRSGERIEGLAEGVDRRRVPGRGPIERQVDLHGEREDEARETTLLTLRLAIEHGERKVLVVHGRGLRSEAGPILKEGLVRWLTEPPASRWVLGFSSAPRELGGPGATLVLLRRSKAKAKRPGEHS